VSHRTRNKAFKSKRILDAPPNRFVEAVFGTREERDAFWEKQMLRHPNVVRDTSVSPVAPFATVWRVRWPR
jgi:hypothetical protein